MHTVAIQLPPGRCEAKDTKDKKLVRGSCDESLMTSIWK